MPPLSRAQLAELASFMAPRGSDQDSKDERAYVSKLWADDWDSAEDSANDQRKSGELHHRRHERLVDVKADTANWLRYDDYWKFWAALDQDRRDAYDAWAAGFARLESVRWLELAA
jgi:hypothetical protein